MPPITDTSSGPLTLVGSAPGLSIVVLQTLLNRPNYFDGRFLRADDLRAEQQYVRSLVALSNQAIGSGVAYGFDLERTTGDGLRIRAGLALSPSGRVVHLAGDTTVSVAELVERSSGSGVATSGSGPGGTTAFAPCPPSDAANGPDATVTATPVHLVTVAPAEALCGDEERYGQLCEDACLTDSERSTVIEGVRVRARRIELGGLPTSSTITFGSAHLRSRVATAFFANDPLALPQLISGTGLDSPSWCRGAEPVGADRAAYGMGPDEVALGVLVRSGETTLFVDQWTARRELTEPPATRWWAWRMAMRPWDVFLAHVLQFQCQLAGLVDHGPITVPGDPCEAEREVLHETQALLASFGGFQPESLRLLTDGPVEAGLPDWSHLVALAGRIDQVLAAGGTSGSGSVLVDRGFVGLPSAGYLPVDAEGDVQAQVRAFMGPGVDLRFCAGRADVVPRLLESAQHMDRISLTEGLDDPASRPEVDVLVPDGRVERVDREVDRAGFVGELHLLPRVRRDDPTTTGAVLSVDVVAREHDEGESWGWAMAGFGEAPQNLSVPSVFLAAFGEARVRPREDVDGRIPDAFPVAERQRDEERRTKRMMRVMAEAQSAKRRRETIGVTGERPDDLRVPPGEARSVAVWVDVELGRDPFSTTPGQAVPVTMRASGYSRAKTSPALADVQLTGSLEVLEREVRAGGRGLAVLTRLSGTVRVLADVEDDQIDEVEHADAVELIWMSEARPDGSRLVSISPRPRYGATHAPPLLTFVAGRSGPEVAAALGYRRVGDADATERMLKVNEAWSGEAVTVGGLVSDVALPAPILAMEATHDPAALRTGSSSRDLGEGAIEIIAGDLEHRRPGFRAEARRALFGEDAPTSSTTIHATRDWVLFHRRRTIDCGDTADVVVPTRRYRLFHAAVGSEEELAAFTKRLQEYLARLAAVADENEATGMQPGPMRHPLARMGLAPVDVVEFRGGTAEISSDLGGLRSAWSAVNPGTVLGHQLVGDDGTVDGEDLARQRVVSIRSALSGLLTTAPAAVVRYMSDLPPELRGSGMNGAMVFLTVRQAIEVDRPREMEVLVLGPNDYGMLVEAAAHENVAIDLAAVREAGSRTVVAIDPSSGDAVLPLDRGDLAEVVPERHVLVVPERAPIDPERDRGARLVEVLGGDRNRLSVNVGSTDMPVLILLDPRR